MREQSTTKIIQNVLARAYAENPWQYVHVFSRSVTNRKTDWLTDKQAETQMDKNKNIIFAVRRR